MRYYKIIPISTNTNNIFDAIDMIAKDSNISTRILLEVAGFGPEGNTIDLMMYPPNNYFSVEHLVIAKLNVFFRNHSINIRVSRPMIRRFEYDISNKTKTGRGCILGWR